MLVYQRVSSTCDPYNDPLKLPGHRQKCTSRVPRMAKRKASESVSNSCCPKHRVRCRNKTLGSNMGLPWTDCGPWNPRNRFEIDGKNGDFSIVPECSRQVSTGRKGVACQNVQETPITRSFFCRGRLSFVSEQSHIWHILYPEKLAMDRSQPHSVRKQMIFCPMSAIIRSGNSTIILSWFIISDNC